MTLGHLVGRDDRFHALSSRPQGLTRSRPFKIGEN
jgi:hypothetical protein